MNPHNRMLKYNMVLKYEPYYKETHYMKFQLIYSLYTPIVEHSGPEHLLLQTLPQQWDQILWHMDFHWISLTPAEIKSKHTKICSKCCVPCPQQITQNFGMSKIHTLFKYIFNRSNPQHFCIQNITITYYTSSELFLFLCFPSTSI